MIGDDEEPTPEPTPEPEPEELPSIPWTPPPHTQ